MISAADFATNWQTGMENAGDTIRRGVLATTAQVGQRAKDAKKKMRANILAALEDGGSYDTAMSSPGLQQRWQQGMINKGINRIADGVRQALPAVQRFATQFLPFLAQVQQQIDAMPDITDADAEQRMIANARLIRGFKLQKT